MFLRQSTSQIIRFGPFLDSTDGVTPETALTIAQADMQLSKDGGAFAQKNATGNATHDTDGWYSTTLDTTDSGTTGDFKIQINVAGALPVWVTYFVLTQSAYDALQTGTFNNLGGTAQTADHTAAIADVPNNSEFNARTVTSATYATAANLTTVDTVVDAIKVTTDQFVFTVANQVDSNMLTHTASIPADYITAAGIAASALNGKGDWNIGKTGYSISGTITTLDGLKNFDPVNDTVANVTLVATTTAVTNELSINVVKINGTTVIGAGISADLWRA